MSIRTEISVGEFLDKMTILEIKVDRIRDPMARTNVMRELETLRAAWLASPYANEDVASDRAALKEVNEALWEIEDRLREKEARASFDEEFVALAREVYRTNDRRAAIKKRLNLRLGSALVEEKSHPDYPGAASS